MFLQDPRSTYCDINRVQDTDGQFVSLFMKRVYQCEPCFASFLATWRVLKALQVSTATYSWCILPSLHLCCVANFC